MSCSQWQKFRNALERQLGSIAAKDTSIEQDMQPMQPELPGTSKISVSRKKELFKLWCKVVCSVRSSGSCHDSGREANSTTERCRRMRGNKRQVVNRGSRQTLRMAMKSRKKRKRSCGDRSQEDEEEEVKKSSMTRCPNAVCGHRLLIGGWQALAVCSLGQSESRNRPFTTRAFYTI